MKHLGPEHPFPLLIFFQNKQMGGIGAKLLVSIISVELINFIHRNALKTYQCCLKKGGVF